MVVFTRVRLQDGTVYETEPVESTTEIVENIEELVKLASTNKLDDLRLETTEGQVFIPNEVLKTSVITIVKQ